MITSKRKSIKSKAISAIVAANVNSSNISNIGQELSDTESVSTNKESDNLDSVFEHQILLLSENAIQRNKNIKKLLEEQSAQQKKSFKSAIDAKQ
jgi:hypothetical protein